MKKIEKFNPEVFENYLPSNSTYELTISVTQKLGELNTMMNSIFKDSKVPSRIFAFIEGKYSSKIEGIYTTLFDVVNTGQVTEQQHLIKPLIQALFDGKEIIDIDVINKLERVMNTNTDRESRWKPEFGIYEKKDATSIKIYEPSLDKEFVTKALNEFLIKAKDTKDVLGAVTKHLYFEKLHPFVDANGRIGRLILTRSIVKQTNFSDILPLSWAIFKNKQLYYQSFDISDNDSLDQAAKNMLNIVLKMYEAVKVFLNEIKMYLERHIEEVMASSTKMTREIAESILFTLQTKASYLTGKYKLNSRTVNNIFDKIEGMDFNINTIERKKMFWNVELETLIETIFNG